MAPFASITKCAKGAGPDPCRPYPTGPSRPCRSSASWRWLRWSPGSSRASKHGFSSARVPGSCSRTTTSSSCWAKRRCCPSRPDRFSGSPRTSRSPAYATIPLLIPALTTFGLPLGYEADFFGVGLIFALTSFVVSVAAIDSGSPYAQLGSSRLRSFGAFNEPTVIFVTFVLALTTHTDLPYAFGATIRSGSSRWSSRATC